MNIVTLKECDQLSLAGKITFPEVVNKLATMGIERYICDLIGRQKLYFSNENECYINPIDMDATKVASTFNLIDIKNAISDIQQGKIHYKNFLCRIMLAGCSHYEVFLLGKKVIYFGRDASQHIEYFPNVSP